MSIIFNDHVHIINILFILVKITIRPINFCLDAKILQFEYMYKFILFNIFKLRSAALYTTALDAIVDSHILAQVMYLVNTVLPAASESFSQLLVLQTELQTGAAVVYGFLLF